MPSSDVGSEVFRNFALYCWPWVRSLTHSPDAVTHSPAEITAACPITVTSSRWPRALIRKTQKPLSSLWYVTRSTRPASTSWVDEFRLRFHAESHHLFRRCAHQLRTALLPESNSERWLSRIVIGSLRGTCGWLRCAHSCQASR